MQDEQSVLTRLVDRFAAGRLSRRDLVQNLAAIVAVAAGAAKAEGRAEAAALASGEALAGPASAAQAAAANSATPTFTALGLNHLALRVTDPDRAQAFYQRHLGMTALSIGAALPKVLACGPHTVTLFKGARPEIDHFCFTVPNYDAKAAEARVRAAGLTPEVEDDRVHFRDPDGYRVQVGGPTAGGQRG